MAFSALSDIALASSASALLALLHPTDRQQRSARQESFLECLPGQVGVGSSGFSAAARVSACAAQMQAPNTKMQPDR